MYKLIKTQSTEKYVQCLSSCVSFKTNFRKATVLRIYRQPMDAGGGGGIYNPLLIFLLETLLEVHHHHQQRCKNRREMTCKEERGQWEWCGIRKT